MDRFPFVCASWLFIICFQGDTSASVAYSCTAGNTTCSNVCGDFCTCKRASCDYHSQSTNCYPIDLQCYDYHFLSSDCRRPNVIYTFGEGLCRNMLLQGNCGIEKTIVAVNLFGKRMYSSRGILYQEGINLYPVTGKELIKKLDLRSRWSGPVYGATEKDQSLFEALAYGIYPAKFGECVGYGMPVFSDGSYELSVRTLDGYNSARKQRFFTIKFAGVQIFTEIDLVSLANTRNCHAAFTAIELAANFQVKKNTLEISGFEPVTIDNTTLLEFCYSQCYTEGNSAFTVAGFSVVKNDIEGHHDDCQCWHHDICKCKKRECEFNFKKSECTPGFQGCPTEVGLPSCYRREAIYSTGGMLCRVSTKNASCKVEKTIIALNFGGKEAADTRGIKYQGSELDDNSKHLRLFSPFLLYGVLHEEEPLFQKLMYGYWPDSSENCIAYSIPILEDGYYELSVRTLDGFYNQPGKRLFTIKFAGLAVFPEIDLVKLTRSTLHARYTALDLAILFEVIGTSVLLSGFESVNTNDKQLLLEFCYSNCTQVDPKFVVAAFALVKLGSHTIENSCGAWDQNMCECKQQGCQYNPESNMCYQAVADCPLPADEESCRRTGTWYSYGGVLCKFVEKERGQCRVYYDLLAINFGGPQVTGERGIIYHAGKDVLPVSGIEYLRFYDPVNVIVDVPKDEFLYKNLMFGFQLPQYEGKCVPYKVSISEPGFYELSLKTVDAYFRRPGHRLFTVKFAGISVFPEIDLIRMAGAVSANATFTAIDVTINFQIILTTSRSELILEGFNAVSLNMQDVLLELCFSTCSDAKNTVFVAAAVSLVRILRFQ